MILLYENYNHFELLYDININLDNFILYNNYNIIKINCKGNIKNLNPEGIKFENKYVESKFKSSPNLYDEISNYLKSIQKYETEINLKKQQHPL